MDHYIYTEEKGIRSSLWTTTSTTLTLMQWLLCWCINASPTITQIARSQSVTKIQKCHFNSLCGHFLWSVVEALTPNVPPTGLEQTEDSSKFWVNCWKPWYRSSVKCQKSWMTPRRDAQAEYGDVNSGRENVLSTHNIWCELLISMKDLKCVVWDWMMAACIHRMPLQRKICHETFLRSKKKKQVPLYKPLLGITVDLKKKNCCWESCMTLVSAQRPLHKFPLILTKKGDVHLFLERYTNHKRKIKYLPCWMTGELETCTQQQHYAVERQEEGVGQQSVRDYRNTPFIFS